MARRRKNRETLRAGSITALAGRSEFACEPAERIGFHRVNGEGDFLGSMAGGAFKYTLLKAARSTRYSGQRHPVLAGRTHRPLYNGIAHITLPNERIGVPVFGGLFGVRLFQIKILA